MDDLDFKVVPNSWRNKVDRKRNTRPIQPDDSPIKLELLQGKTVLVNRVIPVEAYASRHLPYRSLYQWARYRGKKLRVFTYDDVDRNIYRGIIMWLEDIAS